eukprot:gene11638-13588_t
MDNDDIDVPDAWDDDEADAYIEETVGQRIKAPVRETVETERKETKELGEEEPMILVNITKFTGGLVAWSEGELKYSKLYEGLMQRINENETSFTAITEDMWARDLAYHTTNRLWKEEATMLETLNVGDFFAVVAYPAVLGGFLVREMWRKIKEMTEWRSVNIIKCVYLARTNRSLIYKHSMALSIEFLAMEQHILGPTAKKMLQEEDQEDADRQRVYERAIERKYEHEINRNIITNFQHQLKVLEGVDVNANTEKIQELVDEDQQQDDQQQQDDDEEDQEDQEEEEEEEENEEGNQEEYIDEADGEGDEDSRQHQDDYYDEEEEEEEDPDLIPPKPRMNVLEQVMAMIFSKLTEVDDKETHFKSLNDIQHLIKEAWIEEFGSLPPSCIWREDMS